MVRVEELMNRFSYHEVKAGQPERFDGIRMKGLVMAMEVEGSCPDSREKSIALTKIEEAVFWANAAIARNEEQE